MLKIGFAHPPRDSVMKRSWSALGLTLVLVASACAADEEPVESQAAAPAPERAASSVAPSASAPASTQAPKQEPLPFKDWKWEGAVGPVVSLAPDYSGSSTRKVSWTPGYYLRYGRLTASNTGGFVTRRNNDDIFQGLALDLKRDDALRFNVALRIDNGRKSSDARGLEGIEDVRRTLRARFSATLQAAPAWKVVSGLNVDVLRRGGGNLLDVGLSNDRPWSESTTWSMATAVTAADATYMRSWYGVTPVDSAVSGKPAYAPGAGLRDVSVASGWRTEIGRDWIVLWGGSVGRLLGPAARSPLTTSVGQWRAYVGLAWRF